MGLPGEGGVHATPDPLGLHTGDQVAAALHGLWPLGDVAYASPSARRRCSTPPGPSRCRSARSARAARAGRSRRSRAAGMTLTASPPSVTPKAPSLPCVRGWMLQTSGSPCSGRRRSAPRPGSAGAPSTSTFSAGAAVSEKIAAGLDAEPFQHVGALDRARRDGPAPRLIGLPVTKIALALDALARAGSSRLRSVYGISTSLSGR